MRPGRSDSPRTLVSNVIRLATMSGRRRHVTERSVQWLLVVMVHELGDDRFCLQIVAAVVIATLVAYRASEAFHDAVGFGVPRLGFYADQVVRLDDGVDIAIDKLATVIVNDSRFGGARRFQRRLQRSPPLCRTGSSVLVVHDIATECIPVAQQAVKAGCDPDITSVFHW